MIMSINTRVEVAFILWDDLNFWNDGGIYLLFFCKTRSNLFEYNF